MQRGSKLFGQSPENGIKYGSVSCGHTNQFLVAALSGVETDEEILKGDDGRISIEKISRNKHGANHMSDALAKGLLWHVVDPIVEDLYPEFANLAQRARQAVGQVQNVETLLEQMCNIQQLATQMIDDGVEPDFSQIASVVIESEPPNPHEIPKACSYVQLYGGGKSGAYIDDLKRFVSLCAPGGRSISADLLTAICKLKFESTELCPDFVTAMLKCTYDCPEKYVKNGICTFVKDTHVSSLEKSRKPAMIEANAHLRAFKRFVLQMTGSREYQEYIVQTGLADTTVVRRVFDLPVSDKFENKTVVEVLRALAQSLIDSRSADIENPFGISEEAASSDKKASPSTSGLVEYDQGVAVGVERSTLAAQGYVVGAHVESSAGVRRCMCNHI
jgi:hypothetical protein